jgi:hypothetical protein
VALGLFGLLGGGAAFRPSSPSLRPSAPFPELLLFFEKSFFRRLFL